MGEATFELVCALCQTLLQPGSSAPLFQQAADALWAVEQRALYAAAQVEDAPAVLPTPTAPPREPSLGVHRGFADGRELRVNLTPTPARCAPLVELTF